MSLTVLTAILLTAASQANNCKAKAAAECCEAKQAVRACVVKCDDVAACCDTPDACICVVSCEATANGSFRKAEKNGTPTVLSFTAEWCGPCRAMSPVIDTLEEDGFAIRRIDIDEHPDLAEKYGIDSIPAFVATVNGREVARAVGKTEKNVLVRLFRRPDAKSACSTLKSDCSTAKTTCSTVKSACSTSASTCSTAKSACNMANSPKHAIRFNAAVPPHAGLHHVAMHAAPGASDVELLVRATYDLPPSKAKALRALLEESVSVDVETKLEGHRLTVTASPEAQRSIGQFIAVLMPKHAGEETVSYGTEKKSTCDACPSQKKKALAVEVKHNAKKACSAGKSACGKANVTDNGEACRQGHSVEAVRITIPRLGPVFAPPLPPGAVAGPHAPWHGGVVVFPHAFEGGPHNVAPKFRGANLPAVHVHAIPEGLDPETIARWHVRMAKARKHLQQQLGLDCEELDCTKAPAAVEESSRDE